MSDLVVHLAAASPLRRVFREPAMRTLVLVGAVLPDLYYKALVVALTAKEGVGLLGHSPLGVLLLAYLACLFFEAPCRPAAFAALLIGAGTHLALDLGKDYLGSGVLPLLFPWTVERQELGFYTPEEELWLAPTVAAAALALEWILARRRT